MLKATQRFSDGSTWGLKAGTCRDSLTRTPQGMRDKAWPMALWLQCAGGRPQRCLSLSGPGCWAQHQSCQLLSWSFSLAGLQGRPGGPRLRLLVISAAYLSIASIWDRIECSQRGPQALLQPRQLPCCYCSADEAWGTGRAKTCLGTNWNLLSKSADWQGMSFPQSWATQGPSGRPIISRSASKSGGQVCSSSATQTDQLP